MPVANGYRGPLKSTSPSAKIFAPPATPILVKLPKRMKFIYFWARTRMVQRGLMVSFFFLTFSVFVFEGNLLLMFRSTLLNPSESVAVQHLVPRIVYALSILIFNYIKLRQS